MSAQLSTGTAEVCFGTYGWEWPSWSTTYYPADLPEEWRSAYYANDALCVCLPPQWLETPVEQVRDWCVDLRHEFRFFLELDGQLADVDSARAKIDLFGDRVAAVCCADAEQARQLSRSGMAAAIEFLVPAGDPRPTDTVANAWCAAASPARIRAAVIEIDAEQPRVWRDALAGLTPRMGGTAPAAIFLRGPGVTPAIVQEFRVMAELMGLA